MPWADLISNGYKSVEVEIANHYRMAPKKVANPFAHESLAAISEGQLVRCLLTNAVWRSRLLGLQCIADDVEAYPEVSLRDLGKKGDVDILAVTPDRPEQGTAIQVKRVKVSEQAFGSRKPNRLSAVDELKRQTNLLVGLGFAQVIASVIVVVDSRMQNRGAYSFAGLDDELRSTIDNYLKVGGLDPVAGFMRYELVQPMDDRPLGTGTYEGRLLRNPTIRQQAPEVTAWIKRIVAKPMTSPMLAG
jgi:hypothetical protein